MVTIAPSIAANFVEVISTKLREAVSTAIEQQATHGEKTAKSPHPCAKCGSHRNYGLEPELSVWVGYIGIARVLFDDSFLICLDCGSLALKHKT